MSIWNKRFVRFGIMLPGEAIRKEQKPTLIDVSK
jgi:hypothetical protein